MWQKRCKKCKTVKLTGQYKAKGLCASCSMPPPPPTTSSSVTRSTFFEPIELKPRGNVDSNTLRDGERDEQRHFTEKQREKIFARDNFMCRECRSNESLEADHIEPWARGGRTIIENAQTLCSDCNKRKSDN